MEKSNLHINSLKECQNNHILWQNDLLKDCDAGRLSKKDFKRLFTEYAHYSRGFTKLLAIGLLKADNDSDRSIISENLWEERGEEDPTKRHAEIYRQFLSQGLGIDTGKMTYSPYSLLFSQQYQALCLQSDYPSCLAILAFATEGLVSRLYEIFRTGLLKAGFKKEELTFFNLHIGCDDGHAESLENLFAAICQTDNGLENARHAVDQALHLRNAFFNHVYAHIQQERLQKLADQARKKEPHLGDHQDHHIHQINGHHKTLYKRDDKDASFSVTRIPVTTDILDPRVLTIPTGGANENHQHAHETILLVLEGQGTVFMGTDSCNVQPGDLIHVPRWEKHQTKNRGPDALKIFAVTDAGFTQSLTSNTDHSYRQQATGG